MMMKLDCNSYRHITHSNSNNYRRKPPILQLHNNNRLISQNTFCKRILTQKRMAKPSSSGSKKRAGGAAASDGFPASRKRLKAKVGKRALKAVNATDVSFSTTSIYISKVQQQKQQQDGGVNNNSTSENNDGSSALQSVSFVSLVSPRDPERRPLSTLLSLLNNHHSFNVRYSALMGVKEAILYYGERSVKEREAIYNNLTFLMPILSKCLVLANENTNKNSMSDNHNKNKNNKNIRMEALRVIQYLMTSSKGDKNAMIRPFLPLLKAYISSALNSLSRNIRLEGGAMAIGVLSCGNNQDKRSDNYDSISNEDTDFDGGNNEQSHSSFLNTKDCEVFLPSFVRILGENNTNNSSSNNTNHQQQAWDKRNSSNKKKKRNNNMSNNNYNGSDSTNILNTSSKLLVVLRSLVSLLRIQKRNSNNSSVTSAVESIGSNSNSSLYPDLIYEPGNPLSNSLVFLRDQQKSVYSNNVKNVRMLTTNAGEKRRQEILSSLYNDFYNQQKRQEEEEEAEALLEKKEETIKEDKASKKKNKKKKQNQQKSKSKASKEEKKPTDDEIMKEETVTQNFHSVINLRTSNNHVLNTISVSSCVSLLLTLRDVWMEISSSYLKRHSQSLSIEKQEEPLLTIECIYLVWINYGYPLLLQQKALHDQGEQNHEVQKLTNSIKSVLSVCLECFPIAQHSDGNNSSNMKYITELNVSMALFLGTLSSHVSHLSFTDQQDRHQRHRQPKKKSVINSQLKQMSQDATQKILDYLLTQLNFSSEEEESESKSKSPTAMDVDPNNDTDVKDNREESHNIVTNHSNNKHAGILFRVVSQFLLPMSDNNSGKSHGHTSHRFILSNPNDRFSLLTAYGKAFLSTTTELEKSQNNHSVYEMKMKQKSIELTIKLFFHIIKDYHDMSGDTDQIILKQKVHKELIQQLYSIPHIIQQCSSLSSKALSKLGFLYQSLITIFQQYEQKYLQILLDYPGGQVDDEDRESTSVLPTEYKLFLFHTLTQILFVNQQKTTNNAKTIFESYPFLIQKLSLDLILGHLLPFYLLSCRGSLSSSPSDKLQEKDHQLTSTTTTSQLLTNLSMLSKRLYHKHQNQQNSNIAFYILDILHNIRRQISMQDYLTFLISCIPTSSASRLDYFNFNNDYTLGKIIQKILYCQNDAYGQIIPKLKQVLVGWLKHDNDMEFKVDSNNTHVYYSKARISLAIFASSVLHHFNCSSSNDSKLPYQCDDPNGELWEEAIVCSCDFFMMKVPSILNKNSNVNKSDNNIEIKEKKMDEEGNKTNEINTSDEKGSGVNSLIIEGEKEKQEKLLVHFAPIIVSIYVSLYSFLSKKR